MTRFNFHRRSLPLLPAILATGLLAAPGLAFAQAAPTPGMPASGSPVTTAPAPSMDRVTGQPITPGGSITDRAGQTGSSAPVMAQPGTAPLGSVRASKLIGSSVYNDQDTSIGSIDDVLMVRDGRGSVAVISVGGFLGMGARLVTVPMEELAWHSGNSRWTLRGATKESLQARPAFDYDTMPKS